MFKKGDRNRVDPDWLKGIEFFAGFSDPEISAVSELGRRRDIGPNTNFVEQGRYGTECFIVASGEANVYIAGDYVATVGPGSMVGEMALIEHRPRNATVSAATDMELVEFGIEEFKRFLDTNASAKQTVLALLNRRLKENQER